MRLIQRLPAPPATVGFTTALAVALVGFAPPSLALAAPRFTPLHTYDGVALSPDGRYVAALESDEAAIEGTPVRTHLVVRPTAGGPPRDVPLPCAPSTDCVPGDVAWSPDASRFVFVLRAPKTTTRSLFEARPTGEKPREILRFDGLLNAPRFSRTGALAVLATAGAHKEIGATQAGAAIVGEIGAANDEQRIALVAPAGRVRFASPPDLFVYEYDWKPDGSGFVGTAAPGNGDDDWWIAHLYAFDAATARATDVYAPDIRRQLAEPRVSPDGTTVAFIGGIMSDFGSTGGDVFAIPIAGGTATDLTPNLRGSATSLAWTCASGSTASASTIAFTTLEAENEATHTVATTGALDPTPPLRFGPVSATEPARACGANARVATASVVQTFERAPAIVLDLGTPHARQLTRENDAQPVAVHARSIAWQSDGRDVQGWLLEPAGPVPVGKRPMITSVHGGPSAAATPRFVGRGGLAKLTAAGYDVFLPNPRGSFGQGEAFTLANVADFGYGDLRDDLAGIDAVERVAPVDDARLGITGGSYGGFMTMWTVTQTKRFKAAVAGAGIANWQSYYGENGIDRWMVPFFGATAYDDPAVYRKSSPIEFITHVSTPTFAYVGERDVECPAPQSLEFWHALETLHVPTQLVIYPGEGHRLRKPADIADVTRRTVAWFDRYLK